MAVSAISSRPFTSVNSLIKGVTGNLSPSETNNKQQSLERATKNAEAVTISFSAEAIALVLKGGQSSIGTTNQESRTNKKVDTEASNDLTGTTINTEHRNERVAATSSDSPNNQNFKGYDKQGKPESQEFSRNPNKQTNPEASLDIVA